MATRKAGQEQEREALGAVGPGACGGTGRWDAGTRTRGVGGGGGG